MQLFFNQFSYVYLVRLNFKGVDLLFLKEAVFSFKSWPRSIIDQTSTKVLKAAKYSNFEKINVKNYLPLPHIHFLFFATEHCIKK